MNTQDQSPKNNAELNDAPCSVTPESSRTAIPSYTLKANHKDFPFLSFSTPFFLTPRRFESHAEVPQDDDRRADLLRALPLRMISLQRRALNHVQGPLPATAPEASRLTMCPSTLIMPIMPYSFSKTEEEKKLSRVCATPEPEHPRKRQRLSSPPVLPHGADVCREPLPFAPSSRVPSNLLLPSF